MQSFMILLYNAVTEKASAILLITCHTEAVHIAGEPLACGTHTTAMPLLTDSVDIDVVVVGIEFFLADGDALFRGADVDGVLLVFL